MDRINLIHGDCMEYMRGLPDKAFDLAIVDPPYNIAGSPSRHGGSGAGKLKNRILNKNAAKFKEWDIAPGQEYFDELFRISRNQIIWGGKIHPTQKPIALYKWLLERYAEKGSKIIDTHLGSDSSAIAAWELGFEFTGIEIDEEYYDAALKRFRAYTAQLRLNLG